MAEPRSNSGRLAAKRLRQASEPPRLASVWRRLGWPPPLRGLRRLADATRCLQEGKTPGMLLSLPGEQCQSLSFASKEVEAQVGRLGRTGWAAAVFEVQVAGTGGEPGTTYQALVSPPACSSRGLPAAGRSLPELLPAGTPPSPSTTAAGPPGAPYGGHGRD